MEVARAMMVVPKKVTGSAHHVASWFLWGMVFRSQDYVKMYYLCGIYAHVKVSFRTCELTSRSGASNTLIQQQLTNGTRSDASLGRGTGSDGVSKSGIRAYASCVAQYLTAKWGWRQAPGSSHIGPRYFTIQRDCYIIVPHKGQHRTFKAELLYFKALGE